MAHRASVFLPALAFLVVAVLTGGALAAPRISVAQQACSFDGQLQTNPNKLAQSEPVQGNSDADLLVTEFFDPNCPHCQRLHPVMQEVLQTYGDKIRFYMQPLPGWGFSLPQIRAIILAKEKDKYYEMIDAQLTSRNAGKGGLTTEQIVELAEQIGIDPEWMRERLASSAKQSAVNRLAYEAQNAGVQRMPTLAIGRKAIMGHRSASCLGRLIEQELATDH
jgi:protein-disulfide isomerase